MTLPRFLGFTTAAAAAFCLIAPAMADVDKGKKAFNKCKACHEVATDRNKVGPTLKGVFGRTAGTLEGFAFSDAMKASGIVWSEETLKPYLTDPKAVVPGTKMTFAGIKKEEELDNLIEYLAEATK